MTDAVFSCNPLGGLECSAYDRNDRDTVDLGDGIEVLASKRSRSSEKNIDAYGASSRMRCPMAVLLPGTW